VDMRCCNLPKETATGQNCTAKFYEKELLPERTIDKSIAVDVAVTQSLEWTHLESTATEFTELPIAVPKMPEKLIGIFAYQLNKHRLRYKWNRNRIMLGNNVERKSISVSLKAGHETLLVQPVGVCGWLTLNDDCIIKVEFKEVERITTICYGSGAESNGLRKLTSALCVYGCIVIILLLVI